MVIINILVLIAMAVLLVYGLKAALDSNPACQRHLAKRTVGKEKRRRMTRPIKAKRNDRDEWDDLFDTVTILEDDDW